MAVIKTRGVGQVQPGNIGGGFLSPSASGRSFSEGAEDAKFLASLGTSAANTYIKVTNAQLRAEAAARRKEAGKQQADANKVYANNGYNLFASDLRKIEAKYKDLRGQDGADIYDAAEKEVLELKQRYDNALGNMNQKAQFSVLSRQTINSSLDRIMGHQRKQLERFNGDVLKATNQNLSEDTLMNLYKQDGGINYDKVIENEYGVARTTRKSFEKEPMAIRDNQAREAVQKYHSDNIDTMFVRKDYKGIKEYMGAFKDRIDPAYKNEMNSKIEEEMFDEDVIATTTKIMGMEGGQQKWFQEAEKIADAKKQKAVKGAIRQRHADYKRAFDQRQLESVSDAWSDVFKNGMLASKWRNPYLPRKERQAMERAMKDLENPEYNSDLEMSAVGEIMAGSEKRFKKLDLNKYIGKISPQRFIQYKEWQFRLRNAKTSEEEVTSIRRARTASQQIATYGRLNISDKQDRAAFYDAAYKALENEKRRMGLKKGEQPSEEEVKKIISDVEAPVTMERWYWKDKELPKYQMYKYDEEEVDDILKKNPPANLSHLRNLRYNPDKNTFYLEDHNKQIVEEYDYLGRIIFRK